MSTMEPTKPDETRLPPAVTQGGVTKPSTPKPSSPSSIGVKIIKQKKEDAREVKPPKVTPIVYALLKLTEKVTRSTAPLRLQFSRAFAPKEVQQRFQAFEKSESFKSCSDTQKISLLSYLNTVHRISEEVRLHPIDKTLLKAKLKNINENLNIPRELESSSLNKEVQEVKIEDLKNLQATATYNSCKSFLKDLKLDDKFLKCVENLVQDEDARNKIIDKVVVSGKQSSLSELSFVKEIYLLSNEKNVLELEFPNGIKSLLAFVSDFKDQVPLKALQIKFKALQEILRKFLLIRTC